jgi:hypothetical protein
MSEERRPGPAEGEWDEKEMEEQLQALRESQRLYLEKSFQWLIDFVGSYFPEDRLAIRDMDLEVHFVHSVAESGKVLGALVYRFRKFRDKKEYFREMAEDYREGLELPEVLFVDSETSDFSVPEAPEFKDNFIEIPEERLTGRIRVLREELKKRAKVRQLRQGL